MAREAAKIEVSIEIPKPHQVNGEEDEHGVQAILKEEHGYDTDEVVKTTARDRFTPKPLEGFR